MDCLHRHSDEHDGFDLRFILRAVWGLLGFHCRESSVQGDLPQSSGYVINDLNSGQVKTACGKRLKHGRMPSGEFSFSIVGNFSRGPEGGGGMSRFSASGAHPVAQAALHDKR